MNTARNILSFLLIGVFLVSPLSVLAEDVIADPAVEEASQETVVIEEPGEILATSTEVLFEEVTSEPEVLTIPEDSYVLDEVIVKYEDDAEPVLVITEDVPDLILELSKDPEVEYVEPNYLRRIEVLSSTTDPYAEELWGLASSSFPEAWSLSTGEGVVVAVIDSAIDYTHPDLVGRMWDGSACVGTDAEGNAISGGCVHGFDFVDNDTDPGVGDGSDGEHGTHVAGTIAATYNNHVGVIGAAPGATIMALRIIGNNNSGSVSDEAAAIRFAMQNGASIINASFSGPGDSETESDPIQEFTENGGLFIAAAANGGDDGIGDDLDNLPNPETDNAHAAYPAQYPLSGIISVAATNKSNTLASFSNYGAVSVDLGAPGVSIQSTVPGGYDVFSGTSMATPHVAGAVAVLKAFRPALSSEDLKDLILDEGTPVGGLAGKTVSGKRLNVHAALLAAEALTADTNPPVITLNGANPYAHLVGQPFFDPGASATDETDGDLTNEIVVSGAMNSDEVGTYTLTYTVSDHSGNTSFVTREVEVKASVEETPRRRGGGGGGGGGSKKDDPDRFPQVLGTTTPLTPEVQAKIEYLMSLVRQLLALIAAMKAAGLE